MKRALVDRLLALALAAVGALALGAFIATFAYLYTACFTPGEQSGRYFAAALVSGVLTFCLALATAALTAVVSDR